MCFSYAVAVIELSVGFSLGSIIGWTGEATTSAEWSSLAATNDPWFISKTLWSRLEEDRENLRSECSLLILISSLERRLNYNYSFTGTLLTSATWLEGKLTLTAVSLSVYPFTCIPSRNMSWTHIKNTHQQHVTNFVFNNSVSRP